jgi:hypothetical protein
MLRVRCNQRTADLWLLTYLVLCHPRPPYRLLYSLEMRPAEPTRSQQIQCDGCGQITPSYDIVNYGSIERGYRELCSQCFNQEVAKLGGLDTFEHPNFESIGLADCTGKVHEFHFRTRLLGTRVSLDAFELRGGHPAGYQFQIIGGPEDDLLLLLGRLIEKMRRALSTKHLTTTDFGRQIANSSVLGRIEWDDAHNGQVPLLIIDGQEVTWQEFGRMLMSFEGWQFQLNIRDKSEEF